MPGSTALPPSPPTRVESNATCRPPTIVRFLHTECNEELFCPQYIRNNKATGHKNLRCFPHCCQGHKSRSYCGSSLTVACSDSLCEYVFGRFELENKEDENNSINEKIQLGDIHHLRDFRMVIKTKTNPLASWMQGTELSKDEPLKLFELNENRISWHYGYVSNRFSTDATHCFRVYFFKRCSLNNDEIECIGELSSTPFRLVSSRQIRKEAQTMAPSILSLVDLDKISDDRFSYMSRAVNLSIVQTVLTKIGEFERASQGISLASLTFYRSCSQGETIYFQSLLPSSTTNVSFEDNATTAISLLVGLVDRIMQADFVVKIQSILAALASCVSSASKLNKAFGGFIEMLEMQIFSYIDKTLLGLPHHGAGITPAECVDYLVQYLRSRLPSACFVADDDEIQQLGLKKSPTNMYSMSQEPPYFVALVAQLRLKFQQSLLQRTPLPTLHGTSKQQHGKWRRVDSERPKIPQFLMREYAFYISQRMEIVSSDSEIQLFLPDSLIPVWTTFHLTRTPTRPSPGHMGLSSHVGMNGRTVTAYVAWREGSQITIESYMWPMRPGLSRIRFTRHIQMDTSQPESDRLMVTNELEQANHDPICPPVDADIHAQLSYPATYFPVRKYTEYYERDMSKKRKAAGI